MKIIAENVHRRFPQCNIKQNEDKTKYKTKINYSVEILEKNISKIPSF